MHVCIAALGSFYRTSHSLKQLGVSPARLALSGITSITTLASPSLNRAAKTSMPLVRWLKMVNTWSPIMLLCSLSVIVSFAKCRVIVSPGMVSPQLACQAGPLMASGAVMSSPTLGDGLCLAERHCRHRCHLSMAALRDEECCHSTNENRPVITQPVERFFHSYSPLCIKTRCRS